MILVKEQRLVLEFPEHWLVIKYDDETAYRHHAHKLPGTKAVDVIALDPPRKRLYLIELKDFRGHSIENRARLRAQGSRESVFQEIGEKVRDSIAGIIGAFRMAGDPWPMKLAPIVTHLTDRLLEVAVVALIEEDRQGFDTRARLATYTRSLAPMVRWLTTRVEVASATVNPLESLGIRYRALPSAE